MRKAISAVFAFATCLFLAGPAISEQIIVVAWNIEDYDFGGSNAGSGSDGAIIASQLRDDFDAVDVFALSEISSEKVLEVLATIAGQDEPSDYLYVFGQTGGSIRLGLLINEARFDILDTQELDLGLHPTGTRFPLAAKLKSKATGLEFFVVANHFARGNEANRIEQSDALREWVADRTVPVVAAGDFNFDYHIVTEDRHPAFDRLVRNDVLKWVRPDELIDTSWSGGDVDSYPDQILDFVFVSGEGRDWQSSSLVYVRPGDFPDKGDTADHRPVVAFFETSGPSGPSFDVRRSLSNLVVPSPTRKTPPLRAGKPRIVDTKPDTMVAATQPKVSDALGGGKSSTLLGEPLPSIGIGDRTILVIDPDKIDDIPPWILPFVWSGMSDVQIGASELEGGWGSSGGFVDGDNGR